MSEFKKNISVFLKRYGMSYNELDRQAGFPEGYTKNFMKKTQSLNIDFALRIANVFKISLDKLVGNTEDNFFDDTDVRVSNIPLLAAITNYLYSTITEANNEQKIPIDRLTGAIKEIYRFSAKKNEINKEFADSYIKTYMIKSG